VSVPRWSGNVRWDEPVEPVPAPLRFVRLRFFDGGPDAPPISEVQEALELTRRLLVRAHLLAQPFGASGRVARVRVARVTMASPLEIVAELPEVLRVVAGIGALVTLARDVGTTRPRVQADGALLETITAEAERQRAEASPYLRGLVGSVRPDRVDISIDPQPDETGLRAVG
jgi:hypothetical protein